MNYGLSGRYSVYLRKEHEDASKNVKILEFDNLITNNGLDLIGKRSNCGYLIASSNNTEPKISDTSVNVLGYATFSSTTHGDQKEIEPYWVSVTKVAVFGAGVATGNISKFAVSYNSAGTDLASIALVKDSIGNPTVITKLSDEILEVYYELRTYINTETYVGSIEISGITHKTESRTAGINQINGSWFNDLYETSFVEISNKTKVDNIFNYNSGFNSHAPSYSPYVLGSYQIQATPRSLTISEANYPEGISTITFRVGFYQEIFISPPIMKTATDSLSFPPLTISWGRYVAP